MSANLIPLRVDTHGVIPYAGENLPLHEVESILLALTEVDAEALPLEVREQYESALIEAVRTSVDKRERVAYRLFDLGQRAEVKRAAAAAHRKKADELERSAQSFERQADGLKDYVLRVMAELPKPKRGVRTLEGTSATFKAKAVVDAVEITDEVAVPLAHKTAELKMPADVWESIKLAATTLELMQIKISIAVSRTLVKEALQETVPCALCEGTGAVEEDACNFCRGAKVVPASVPGARLLADRLRLEVS